MDMDEQPWTNSHGRTTMDKQPWTINGLKHVEQLFFIVHSCLSMAVRPWLFVHGCSSMSMVVRPWPFGPEQKVLFNCVQLLIAPKIASNNKKLPRIYLAPALLIAPSSCPTASRNLSVNK